MEDQFNALTVTFPTRSSISHNRRSISRRSNDKNKIIQLFRSACLGASVPELEASLISREWWQKPRDQLGLTGCNFAAFRVPVQPRVRKKKKKEGTNEACKLGSKAVEISRLTVGVFDYTRVTRLTEIHNVDRRSVCVCVCVQQWLQFKVEEDRPSLIRDKE